jgi:8-oxo-dGTP pyrophosphatase MutT (NUDIX family)
MTTTTLVIEILIAGLEVLGFLFLLLIVATPGSVCLLRMHSWAADYKEWSTLITTLVLGLAYLTGVIVDRIAETQYRWFESTRCGQVINSCWGGGGSYWYRFPARIEEMRLRVMKDGQGIAEFINYQRTRVRIARSTVFNLAVFLVLVAACCILQRTGLEALMLIAVGLALLAATYASELLNRAYLERLSDAYCVVASLPLQVTFSRVAAAVCYRVRQGAIEFLLIRTKDSRYWTFPKGHLKTHERPWEAASREAREEAGVVGEVSEKLLANYLYPKPPFEETRVGAYLLNVEALEEESREPAEKGRTIEWFKLPDAIGRVGDGGRGSRYVREHIRVLKTAAKELARLRKRFED